MPPPTSPTTPFAPPVRLGALLAREELGLRLVAGDPEAELHWVHTSEMADPFPYLLGGELLLTAGVQLARTDPGRFVARVAEAGAAALGFGVTPVYDTVPEPLAEACVRHGLPLLEVPPETPFSAVARAVWALMSEARHRELRRATDAQRALAVSAARPDPVPAVLHALAGHLGGRAALYAPDGTEYAADGRGLTPEERAALERLVQVVAGTDRHPASAADTGAGGVRLVAYSLGTGAPGLTLGLAMARREESDQRIAETAMVLLSLLTAPHQAADEATRSAALVRLLLGAAPPDVTALLGEAPWTVVHARSADREAPPPALGSPLVDVRDDGTVRVLLPTAREVGPHPGWTLGVSAPAAPGDLRAADAQAARALRRAEAARTPLSRHHPSGFAALVDEAEAASHARALMAPLSGAPALAETLRAWLSLHGSWDRTATALGVHRNTVRQRIARCASLLDADLDDAEVRMELWFALRWL